jgi:hypothetical protein
MHAWAPRVWFDGPISGPVKRGSLAHQLLVFDGCSLITDNLYSSLYKRHVHTIQFEHGHVTKLRLARGSWPRAKLELHGYPKGSSSSSILVFQNKLKIEQRRKIFVHSES